MSCCAIIVSYHPTIEIVENINALVSQVDEIVIIDNGSGLEAKQLLDNLIKQHSKLNVIFLQENLGIAVALNIGVKKSKSMDHEWVITFDQDSQVTTDMINTMLKVYDAYPKKEKIASLSPRYMDKNTGEICGSHLISPSEGVLLYAETNEVLTSGNLIKLSVFETVGYFNEALFIDYVDTEYCWRCVYQGYKILEVKDATLLHGIGFPVRHDFLWMHPITMNHSAIRRYYIARNAVYVFKVFIISHTTLVIINIYNLIKILVKIALFESDRKKKFISTFLGLVDGLIGRMGKCTRDF